MKGENMVKIAQFQIENVKKVRAVELAPAENGLTIIGGGNAEGKTSILDAILWALGGDRFKPANPTREGEKKSYIKVILDSGIIIERINGSLKVTDPNGLKAGQSLLNEVIGAVSINLPKFLDCSEKERLDMIMETTPDVRKRLQELTREYDRLYSDRTVLGREVDRKRKAFDETPEHVLDENRIIGSAEVMRELDELNQRNGERTNAKKKLDELDFAFAQLQERRNQIEAEIAKLDHKCRIERDMVDMLGDQEDGSVLYEKMKDLESHNAKVRENMKRMDLKVQWESAQAEHAEAEARILEIREQKRKSLSDLCLGLDGLQITEDGVLEFNGQRWDGMSGAERLFSAAALARVIHPRCSFLLLDKLEQMDLITAQRFHQWLVENGMQAIGTRVSSGDECTIIIEDGRVANG